jgi:predicted O-methyltransferase YrrM
VKREGALLSLSSCFAFPGKSCRFEDQSEFEMEFLDPRIEAFTLAHSQEEPGVLKELNRETHARVLVPRMLSGHLQGRVLSMLSRMIRPKRILEIGTYTGYSAICLSEGLQEGGHLHTIDVNEELENMIRRFFKKAGVENRVTLHIGDAMQVIPKLDEKFDLVFIDADKENYGRYYDLVFDRVRPGGYIIADNVLWSGKVLDDASKMDKDTRAILAYNEKVHADKRVDHVLFPIRDGLMIARKKE